MPFIDLSALNPLAKRGDDNQSQTAQATDDQSQTVADPATAGVAPVATDTNAAITPDESLIPQTIDLSVENQLPQDTTNTLELKASSASDEQNLDRSGNPLPQIKVAQDGNMQIDESGMREIKGPEFAAAADSVPTPIAQLDSQDLDAKLNQLATDQGLVPPAPATTLPPMPEAIIEAAPVLPELSAAPAPVVEAAPMIEAQIPEAVPPMIDVAAPTIDVQAAVPAVVDLSPVVPDVQPAAPEIDPVLPVTPAPVDALTQVTSPEPAVLETNVPVQESLPELSAGKKYTIEELLQQAIQMGASDLHLTAGYRAVVRVDGSLRQIQSQLLDDASIKELIKPVIAKMKLENPEDIRDLDMAHQSQDGTRFRVNIFKQQGSQSAVFRVIPSRIQTIEELGLPGKIREFTQMSQGLVLVTGPTGSGKSTTLAAMVNEINMKNPRHIVTIEDPIEFVYPKGVALVDQRGIGQDTDAWENALRSVLRQDPDVVLIGEMRDLETISAALHIAETGHLVFGTLHTNSAAQSIDRIIDVFPKEQQAQIQTQLATVLKAVVSQRLVPLKTGGRRVANEILVSTPAVANSIRSSKVYQIDNIIQTSAELGMISMEKSLVALIKNNLITTEQAQFYANRPDEILSLMGK